MSIKLNNISIVICTHNRARLLAGALRSLEDMRVPEDCKVEVLLINNASTDDTSSIIDNFDKDSKTFAVKAMFEPKLGKTYALNTAINHASGDILAFVDDDHIISKGYLEAVCKATSENPSFNIFCGRLLPNWDGTEPEWVHDNSEYPIRPFPFPFFDLGDTMVEIRPEKGMFLPQGGNLIIRKSVFKKIGLFSKRLGPKGHNLSGGEDFDFVKRALKNGGRLLYIPEILQLHYVDRFRLTLPYLMKKAYFRSMIASQLSDLSTTPHASHIPTYLYKQVFIRLIRALFAICQNARRYYLVKLAATLGEIQGIKKKH